MCNCKKKKEEIKVPQSVEELHAMEMEKHAEELTNQIQEENIQETNQESN